MKLADEFPSGSVHLPLERLDRDDVPPVGSGVSIRYERVVDGKKVSAAESVTVVGDPINTADRTLIPVRRSADVTHEAGAMIDVIAKEDEAPRSGPADDDLPTEGTSGEG